MGQEEEEKNIAQLPWARGQDGEWWRTNPERQTDVSTPVVTSCLILAVPFNLMTKSQPLK